jgi:hypothetical protein
VVWVSISEQLTVDFRKGKSPEYSDYAKRRMKAADEAASALFRGNSGESSPSGGGGELLLDGAAGSHFVTAVEEVAQEISYIGQQGCQEIASSRFGVPVPLAAEDANGFTGFVSWTALASVLDEIAIKASVVGGRMKRLAVDYREGSTSVFSADDQASCRYFGSDSIVYFGLEDRLFPEPGNEKPGIIPSSGVKK